MTHQTEDHQQHVTDIIGPWSVPPVELTLRSSLRRPFHSRRTSTSAAATDVSPSDGEVTRGAENQHLPALNSFFFSSLLNMCNQWKNGSSSGREKKKSFPPTTLIAQVQTDGACGCEVANHYNRWMCFFKAGTHICLSVAPTICVSDPRKNILSTAD